MGFAGAPRSTDTCRISGVAISGDRCRTAGSFIGGFTVAFDEKWAGIVCKCAGLRWDLSSVLAPVCCQGRYISLARRSSWSAVFGHSARLDGERSHDWSRVGCPLDFSEPRPSCAWDVGGMCGGFLVGWFFGTLSQWLPGISQAFAFVLTGAGISFGIAFAPIFLRDAVLRFVNSGDPRALSKLGEKEWAIQEGDSYVLGSQSADLSKSTYGREVDIFLQMGLLRHGMPAFMARMAVFM